LDFMDTSREGGGGCSEYNIVDARQRVREKNREPKINIGPGEGPKRHPNSNSLMKDRKTKRQIWQSDGTYTTSS